MFQSRLALFGKVGTLLSSIALVLMLIISVVLYGNVPMKVILIVAGAASSLVAWSVGRGRPRAQRPLENVDAITTVAISLCFTVMAARLKTWDRPEFVAA